jgi:ABC-type glycerol-3-phosphate transport system substrate-binding protein
MHRITKTVAAVGGVLSLIVLSGCGLGAAPTQTADTSGEVAGTISFQTMQLSPTFDEYINGVIAAFEEKYPGTTVEWTDIPSDQAARKVSADSVAGTLPDVMDLDAATLAPLGRDARVLDMADQTPDLESRYVASAWKSFDFGDTAVAALPWYLNSPVLMGNGALLEQTGSPAAPTTYSELLDASAEIASKTGKAGFQPTSIGLPNYLLSVGVPLVNDDSTAAVVNTPEAADFIGRLAELYASGGIPADSVTAAQRTEIDTFSQGETAYLETGPSRLKIIGQNAPQVLEKLQITEPLGASAGTTWVVAHGLAVPQTSKNAATALAFATFLTSPENQLALAEQSSVFPSTTESLEADFFQAAPTDLATQARQIVATSLFDGGTMPKPAAVDSEYATTLWSAVQTAITGETPVEQALADAESQLTEMLEARTK